jgi:hypothetical protein
MSTLLRLMSIGCEHRGAVAAVQTSGLLKSSELTHPHLEVERSFDQPFEELLIDDGDALIFGGVPLTVTAIEKPPCRRVEALDAAAAPGRLNVVVNWFEEIRRK